MGKQNNKLKISLFLSIVLTISAISSIIPISNAYWEIDPGEYEMYSDTGWSKVTAKWEEASGPAIDVFIFTSLQYSIWLLNTSQDPISYVGAVFNTYSGELTRLIDPDDTTYVIFSNVNGGSIAGMTISSPRWTNDIVGFEFIMVLIGILVLIGITIVLRKRPLRAVRQPLNI